MPFFPCLSSSETHFLFSILSLSNLTSFSSDTSLYFRLYPVSFLLWYFIVACRKFESPYLVKTSSHKSSATHSYRRVQCFRVSRKWCSGFSTCARMSMHAIAHGGCTDTVRESAPKVDSGRIIPCRTRDSNPRQYCAWLFGRTLYQLS